MLMKIYFLVNICDFEQTVFEDKFTNVTSVFVIISTYTRLYKQHSCLVAILFKEGVQRNWDFFKTEHLNFRLHLKDNVKNSSTSQFCREVLS